MTYCHPQCNTHYDLFLSTLQSRKVFQAREFDELASLVASSLAVVPKLILPKQKLKLHVVFCAM